MNKMILLSIILVFALSIIGCSSKPDMDTSTPEVTITSLIANYDYVIDPSEITALEHLYAFDIPEEVDVIVLEDNIKGAYPTFKVLGDKIVPVQYPGSEMTPEEFVDYVINVKHK